MNHPIRRFRVGSQIDIGPQQREQFAVGSHSGIDGENGSVPQILGSIRQIQRLFLETQNAITALRLWQFMNTWRVRGLAPLDSNFQNASQRAQIAVYRDDRVLGYLLPMAGVLARQITCNRV